MNNRELSVGNHMIGADWPCFIIAEMSANHLMDKKRALKIIDAAADAGADAIKIQTYTPDTITLNCDNEFFQITQGTIWDGTTLYKLYQDAYTPWEWHSELRDYSEERGLVFFSSPFDPTSVDFLEKLHVPLYKIASFEITDIPLIEMVARTGKPIIISTGIARIEDIAKAVNACRNEGNDQIALLKCVSSYPAPYEGMNLRTIPNLSETFDVVSGLSDHSMGYEVALASVSIGASIVEKHLTLSRKDGGPDAAFSMEPNEFHEMVCAIRNAEKALGTVSYKLTDKQLRSREHARSLFVVAPIEKGATISSENVRSIRPAFGMPPCDLPKVLGRRAKESIEPGTPLSWDLIE